MPTRFWKRAALWALPLLALGGALALYAALSADDNLGCEPISGETKAADTRRAEEFAHAVEAAGGAEFSIAFRSGMESEGEPVKLRIPPEEFAEMKSALVHTKAVPPAAAQADYCIMYSWWVYLTLLDAEGKPLNTTWMKDPFGAPYDPLWMPESRAAALSPTRVKCMGEADWSLPDADYERLMALPTFRRVYRLGWAKEHTHQTMKQLPALPEMQIGIIRIRRCEGASQLELPVPPDQLGRIKELLAHARPLPPAVGEPPRVHACLILKKEDDPYGWGDIRLPLWAWAKESATPGLSIDRAASPYEPVFSLPDAEYNALQALPIIRAANIILNAAPPDPPKGEHLYPLVTGINGWQGDRNTTWLGDKLVDICIKFHDDEQAKTFHDLFFQVGATPSALNNKENFNAAPCLYALGTLASAQKPGEPAELRITRWVIATPYLCNKSEAMVDWVPLEVEIKPHAISGELPAAAYQKHEYNIAEYSPTEQADYHAHTGMYPVIGVDIATQNATMILAQTRAQTFSCPVQFKSKEQAELFFTPAHKSDTEQARREGAPPTLYLLGRYDQKRHVFIAKKWMTAAQIATDIEELDQPAPRADAP